MANNKEVGESSKNARVEESAFLPIVQFGAVTGERPSFLTNTIHLHSHHEI